MHWNSNLEARGTKREKYIAPKANDSFSQIRLSPYVQCSIVESQLWAYLRSAAMKEKVILTEVALNVKRRNLQHASSLNYHRYNLKLKVI